MIARWSLYVSTNVSVLSFSRTTMTIHNTRQCLQPSTAKTHQGSCHPAQICCPECLRSVLCRDCALQNGTASTSKSHDRLECEALVALSALQREQPGLAESLLGGSTIYLRSCSFTLRCIVRTTMRKLLLYSAWRVSERPACCLFLGSCFNWSYRMGELAAIDGRALSWGTTEHFWKPR